MTPEKSTNNKVSMTPEAKADELIKRFQNEVTYKGGEDTENLLLLKDEAKQCALICVEQQLETIHKIYVDYGLGYLGRNPRRDINSFKSYKFLQKVKQAIESR